jgi:uncharacterized membrane protein YdjX (TVP38/TMEM64 family)
MSPNNAAGFNWRRLWPLAVLAAGFALFFATGANEYLSIAALREHRAALASFVADNAMTAALLFMLLYIMVVAFSLPGGALMTIVGGFLFGTVLAGLCVVIGATVGATLVFLAAKTALGDYLRAKAGPALQKMEAGFRENAFSYLLVLRLVPVFPFFLVNLVPAFLGVPLRTYVVATFLGIIPGTFVYAQVGTGLGSVLESGEDFSLSGILTPDVVVALCGLAVLAMLPVAYKWWRGRRRPR